MLTQQATGASYPAVNAGIIKSIPIPLPDLETQRKIASNLDKATHTIYLCNTILEKLDMLVKSRFVEMFGSPESNDKHWKIIELESISYIITYGLTVRPTYIEEGIDLVSAKEIRTGYINYNDSPKISQEDFDLLSNKGKPQKNDILFSKNGSIGHCALVTSEKKSAITQNAARIGINTLKANPIWVLQYLRMEYIQDWFKSRAKGNAVKDFQLQDMKAIPLFDCPKNNQDEFAAFVEQTDKSKSAVKKLLDKAETLKKALMQEYFG